MTNPYLCGPDLVLEQPGYIEGLVVEERPKPCGTHAGEKVLFTDGP